MKHIWKRSLSLLLVLSMVLSMVPAVFANQGTEDPSQTVDLPEEKGETKSTDPLTIELEDPITEGGFTVLRDLDDYADLSKFTDDDEDNPKYFLISERLDGENIVQYIFRPMGLTNKGYEPGNAGQYDTVGSNLATLENLNDDYLRYYAVHLVLRDDGKSFYIAAYNTGDVTTIFGYRTTTRYIASTPSYKDSTSNQTYSNTYALESRSASQWAYPNKAWSTDISIATPFYYGTSTANDKKIQSFYVFGDTLGRALWQRPNFPFGFATPSYAQSQHSAVQGIYLAYFSNPIDASALRTEIEATITFLNDNAAFMDEYNPALVSELNALVVKAADFYNNTANGGDDTPELAAEIEAMANALTKLRSDVAMSRLAVDIPVTFYDFRADGLMFEAGFGEAYSYMMEAPGLSPDEAPAFPGEKGGTLTSAGYGTKTTGLVEPELVNGQLVYKEETVEYIAYLIALGYRRSFGGSYTGVTNHMHDKVAEISAKAGTDQTTQEWADALGSWDATIAKAGGYNGGYFRFDQVETAFDLAYYITTNMWRSVESDDYVDSVKDILSDDNSRLVSHDLPYNLTVDAYDYLRLTKNPETGAYTISSNNPMQYIPATEDSVGVIYNTDLTTETAIGKDVMRFIPMGGNPLDNQYNVLDTVASVPWQGFDALDGLKDQTDLSTNQGFHFAMHASGSFVYQKGLNQYFYFLGDDDVYYFIDGKLVMDLGGGHPPCDDILYLNDIAAELGMVDGGVYTFDMFYIERHTGASNMTFSTNIQIMDTETFTSETQFNGAGKEIPTGTKVEIGETITYQYELLNTRDVPVKNLVFYDEALGVTLSGSVCILNGTSEQIAQVGGNEETNPGNLALYYCGGTATQAEAVAKTYEEIKAILQGALDASTTNGIYQEFGNAAYSVTGLTGEQLMELLALGLPVNCSLAIKGFKRTAKETDQPFVSELYTSCEYEKAVIGDYDYETRTVLLTGSATVSTNVRPEPVFSADKLRYVIDYGKPLEMDLLRIEECILIPESILYEAEVSFAGITDQGTHQQMSTELPQNLGASSVGISYDCPTAFGSFKQENGMLYYTPAQFLETVAKAYAVFKVTLKYNVIDENGVISEAVDGNGNRVIADYYVTAALEIIPATMMYYEAEDFLGSEITYEELEKGGEVNIAPGTKTDADLGYTTNTDSTPAQDTHYAEGKAKDVPGDQILIDFDNDEESAQRYTDKAYYFAQERINWDDSAYWQGGTVSDGVLTGSEISINRDAGMLNLSVEDATFVEIKVQAPTTGTLYVNLITLNHVGVRETVSLPALSIDEAGSDRWLVADISGYEIIEKGINTLVGIELSGIEGVKIDYIYVGPEAKSPINLNAGDTLYFKTNFGDYIPAKKVDPNHWTMYAKYSDNVSGLVDIKVSGYSGSIGHAKIGDESLTRLTSGSTLSADAELSTASGYLDLPMVCADRMAFYTHYSRTNGDAPTITILVDISLPDGTSVRETVPYTGTFMTDSDWVSADLSQLQAKYLNGRLVGLTLCVENIDYEDRIYLSYAYIGPDEYELEKTSSDILVKGPESSSTTNTPSIPSIGSGSNIFIDFETTNTAWDNPGGWRYWTSWYNNEGYENNIQNKEASTPSLEKDTDNGNEIGVMHFAYDPTDTAHNQLETHFWYGFGLAASDAQYLEIRLKVDNLFGSRHFYNGSPLKFKGQLMMTGNGNYDIDIEVGEIPFSEEGNYFILSCDLTSVLNGNTSTLHGVRLYCDAYTALAEDVYLDYVFVGYKADAPSQEGQTYEPYEEIYGFDSTYTNDNFLSDGESLYIEGKGVRFDPTQEQYEADPSVGAGIVSSSGSYSEFKFSFTGTGFDLISRTGIQQATIRISVYTTAHRTQETLVKALTVMNKGELELHQIPVVSVQALDYGTYYVVVGINTKIESNYEFLNRGNQFYFDALRIYDPINTTVNTDVLEAYRADGEAYPHVKEIRDTLLTASDFASVTLGNSTDGAMFVDTSNYESPATTEPTETTDVIKVTDHLSASVSTYNKVGPKNEVYLSPGQAVAFRLVLDSVQDPTSIDIGAKTILGDRAVLAAGFVTAQGENTLDLLDGIGAIVKSSTSLYYPVALNTLPTGEDAVYLVIYNAYQGEDKTQNILSVTDLKVCYDESPTNDLPADEGGPEIHPTKSASKAEAIAAPYRFMVDGMTLKAAAFFIRSITETPVEMTDTKIYHSLNLESDISLNYIVPKAELEGYDSFYLECNLPQYEGNTLVGETTVTITPVLKGEYYYFTLEELTAVRMNDRIHATLYMEQAGTTYCSAADVYSIAQYAYSQLGKDNASQSLKTLCADLLRYGAKAQTYKDYRTDSLADNAMTEEQGAYLTDLETVTFGNTSKVLSDLDAPTVQWAGKALVLDSRVTVRYIVDLTVGVKAEDLSLRIRYTDLNGTEQEVILTGAQPYANGENRYAFDFDGLLAAQLRTVLSAAVYVGDTQVSNTLLYSADTYGNNKTGTLLELCKALVAYSDSAKAYFSS